MKRVTILSCLTLLAFGLIIYDMFDSKTVAEPVQSKEMEWEIVTGVWSQDTFKYEGEIEPTIVLHGHDNTNTTITVYKLDEDGEREKVIRKEFVLYVNKPLSLQFPEAWQVGTYEAEANTDGAIFDLGTMKIEN